MKVNIRVYPFHEPKAFERNCYCENYVRTETSRHGSVIKILVVSCNSAFIRRI